MWFFFTVQRGSSACYRVGWLDYSYYYWSVSQMPKISYEKSLLKYNATDLPIFQTRKWIQDN